MIKKLFSNRLYQSALGVAVVFAVGLAYIFAAVLDQPLTSRPQQVTVALRSTGGLYDGSSVTYRGIKVGKVTGIDMTTTGVEAIVSLTTGTNIPVDSVARVRSLSPVGEQYLDFQPNSESGPYLVDGSTIPVSATRIPKSLGSTVVAVNSVLRQIDDKKLHTVLRELSVGLKGTGTDVGQMIDQGDLLLADLERLWPETDRLLTNGGTVLNILPNHAGDLERLGSSARQLAAFMRDYDPELRRTIRRLPGQFKQLERLVKDASEVLPGFLSAGVSLTDLTSAHDPALRRLLGVYASGLGALADQIRGGKLFLEILGQKDDRCSYGRARQAPTNPHRRELPRDNRCPASFSTLQRGAAHASGR